MHPFGTFGSAADMASSDILPYIYDPESEDETEKTQLKSHSSKLTVRRFRKSKRIYIGGVLKRWREFRKLQGIETDEELAKFLLDSHPSSCIVFGCRKKAEPYARTLHHFPEDLETIKVWKQFVQKTNTGWDGRVSPWKKICSEHFEPSCYTNHMAWSKRSVQNLVLKDDFQVPTIYPTEGKPASHDGGSLDQPQQAAAGETEAAQIPESLNESTKVAEGNAQQPVMLQLAPLELHQSPLSFPSFCVNPLVVYAAAAPYQVQSGLTKSLNAVGDKSYECKGCQTENVTTSADENGHIKEPCLPKDKTAEDTDSRDSDVCDEDNDVSRYHNKDVEDELILWLYW